jgi:hypothetical protein
LRKKCAAIHAANLFFWYFIGSIFLEKFAGGANSLPFEISKGVRK